MTPVRWTVEVEVAERTRTLELGAGEVLPVDGQRVTVSSRGELVVDDTVAAVGTPVGALTLRTPPHLKAGKPAEGLTKWALEVELQRGDRTQPFRFTRVTGELFSLGRHDQNVLRMPAESLARRHTAFFVDAAGRVWVDDLSSPGGTWHGTTRLSGWGPLPEGELRAGDVTVRFASPRG